MTAMKYTRTRGEKQEKKHTNYSNNDGDDNDSYLSIRGSFVQMTGTKSGNTDTKPMCKGKNVCVCVRQQR